MEADRVFQRNSVVAVREVRVTSDRPGFDLASQGLVSAPQNAFSVVKLTARSYAYLTFDLRY